MKRFFLLATCLVLAAPAWAQRLPKGEVTPSPLCFDVINRADFNIFGQIMSDYYFTPDGTKAYHRSNFNLKPLEKAQICSTGPFYDGRKLNLSLRTVIPVFSCKTGVDGPVEIHSRPKQGGGNEIWADCR